MNFTIRKFYDTAEAETGGGSEAAVAEKEAPQVTSIAEAMAKHGVKNSGLETPELKPVDIKKEVAEKPKEEKQSESAETAAKVEKPTEAKTETTEKKPEVKEEPKVETKKEEAHKPQPTFEEVLKSQPRNAVLKALGLNDKTISVLGELNDLDEKTIGLLVAHKDGKEADYLRELTTDYSKMSSEEVMRHQLRLDYPKASQKQLDALFKKEVTEAYNLDSDDKDDVEEGQMLLDAKADKHRDSFIEKQKDFLVPKYEPKQPEKPDNTQELEVEKRNAAYKEKVNSSQFYKDIATNKSISIGDGDEKFTFPVEPSELSDILFNTDKWIETQYDVERDTEGNVTKVEPKVEHQLLVAAVAKNGMKLFEAYAQHLKSLGGKKVVDTIENAKKSDSSTETKSEKQPSTVAEHMAKSGRLNQGGQ